MKAFHPHQDRAVVIVDDALFRTILRRQRQTGDFLRFDLRRSSELNARFEPTYYAECLRAFEIVPAHADLIKPYLLAALDKEIEAKDLLEWKRIATHLFDKGILRRSRPLPDDCPIECWNDPNVEPYLVAKASDHLWEERRETPWKRLIANDEHAQLRYAVQLVARWLEEGVSMDRIVIANAMPEDRFLLRTLAKRYGFRLSDDERTPLIQLPSVGRFWHRMDNMDPIQALDEVFPDEKDPIKATLREMIEMYVGFPDSKQWIGFELKRRTVVFHSDLQGVKLVALSELSALDDVKTIVLHACEGSLPPLAQDDEILSDHDKPLLGIRTSMDENTLRRRRVARIVEGVEDLVLIVPAKVLGNPTVGIDPSMFRRPCQTIHPSESWLERSLVDARFLFASLSHDVSTYGVRSALYHRLNASFPPIDHYDPRFRGIDSATNRLLLKSPTTLSATSLETFFSCRFRYLLTHLLKMEPTRRSLSADLGTAVHQRLEQLNQRDQTPFSLSSTEYGTARLRSFELAANRRLDRVVERLLKHATQTAFRDVAHEVSVSVPIQGTNRFVLKGRIDRIMAHRLDNQDYLVVIDYKTGTAMFDEEAFEKGMDLQLIVYLELMRNLPEYAKAKIAGFLIQPIPLGRLSELKRDDDLADRMKMKGYLIDRTDLAKAFDSGGFVRGLAFKNDGTFQRHAKVVDEHQFDVWLAKLQDHLQTAVRQIEQGDYRITPFSKNPGESESVSCQYCPFAGICYSANRTVDEAEDEVERGEDDAWLD